MRDSLQSGRLFWAGWMLAAPSLATGAIEGEAAPQPVNQTAVIMFLVFVLATLFITWRASRATTTSSVFYNAGGQITGAQNGMAIAGDFMSAASFLGITGLMFVGGFDGLILSLGAFGAWPLLMFLFAKRVRNLGSFTFIDVISQRLQKNPIRVVTAFSTIVVVVMYLIAQMVGAGKLIQLLFGLPYELALVIVSGLVLGYVAFGADWRDSHRFFASRQTRFQLFRVAGAGDSQSPQRRGYFVLGGHI